MVAFEARRSGFGWGGQLTLGSHAMHLDDVKHSYLFRSSRNPDSGRPAAARRTHAAMNHGQFMALVRSCPLRLK